MDKKVRVKLMLKTMKHIPLITSIIAVALALSKVQPTTGTPNPEDPSII